MDPLNPGSPEDWLLKGQGNANAVFGYCGADNSLVGQVLRVRKLTASVAQTDAASEHLTQELWGDAHQQGSGVAEVFAAVLGPHCISAGVRVNLPDAFVSELNTQLQLQQSTHRPAASLSPSAVLLPDTTIFQQACDYPRSCITINVPDLTCSSCICQTDASQGQHPHHANSGPSVNAQQQQQQQATACSRLQKADLCDKSLSCASQPAIEPTQLQMADACNKQQSQAGHQAIVCQNVHCNEGQSSARQHAKMGYTIYPTLCVEIKPKWGLLPTSPAIPAEHEVRRRVSRFQLQQQLKVAQGKTDSISEYDPLDLFSADASRMQKAVLALFANPQNNIKLFLDGNPVETSGSSAEACSLAAVAAKHLGIGNDQMGADAQAEQVASILTKVLLQEGVLQRLLKLQALDSHDIEAVYPLYQHVMHQLTTATHARNIPDTGIMQATDDLQLGQSKVAQPESSAVQVKYVQTLLAMCRKDQVDVIRQYLLAATAKDCSLMITMQALPTAVDMPTNNATPMMLPELNHEGGAVLSDSCKREIVYKLTVVDLDLKPHSKIRAHYSLNCEIMKGVLATAHMG